MNILKDSTAACTRRRLILLLALNVSDWICTLALLSTGMFEEANPLMRRIMESPLLGFIVKALIPFSLIVYALSKLKGAEPKQVLISNNIALAGVAVYVLVNIYHLICFSALFYYNIM